MNIKPKARWVAVTGVLLALLIALQAVTAFGGQILTGSCVNFVLTSAVFAGGFWSAFTVALLSPFCAFLVGVGPKLFPLVPFIALGNLAYVSLLFVLGRKDAFYMRAGAVGMAAVAKFIVLWATLLRVVIPGLGLPEQQMNTLGLMFSWPQVMTALIGGILASATVWPLLKKIRRE